MRLTVTRQKVQVALIVFATMLGGSSCKTTNASSSAAVAAGLSCTSDALLPQIQKLLPPTPLPDQMLDDLLPHTGTTSMTVSGAQGTQTMQVKFLACGSFGSAFQVIDGDSPQVIKVPKSDPTALSMFDNEMSFFSTTKDKLISAGADAKLFADFMVDTTVADATYGGVASKVLVKRFVNGTELHDLDATRPDIKAQLDLLYQAYRGALAAGVVIGDLHANNIMWDNQLQKLQIIDAIDYSYMPMKLSMKFLCTNIPWCSDRLAQELADKDAAAATPEVSADEDSPDDVTNGERAAGSNTNASHPAAADSGGEATGAK